MKSLQSIVFFGSHELALPALEVLAELELTPRWIVTHPRAGFAPAGNDDPPHPVRSWAQERGIEVIRSRRATEEKLQQRVAALEPDLLVVVDYGRPLPAALAAAASRGAIEVHPSLLPHLRGPHALRAALAMGRKKTGVTVFSLDEEPWGGPILFQEELEIGAQETFAALLPRAQELSGRLLRQALEKIDRGKGRVGGQPQKNADKAIPCPLIGGRHRKAPWPRGAERIYHRLRAYAPLGIGALFRYQPIEILGGKPMDWIAAPNGATGTYLGMRQGKLAVLCGEGTIFGISRLRWLNGDAQAASDFSIAEKLRVGDRFA